MRVAFLIKSLGGGGAEKVCVTLANRFSQMGHSTEIYAISQAERFDKASLSPDVTLHCAYARKTLFSLPYIYRVLSCGNHDVVMCFGYELAVVSVLLRKCLSVHCAIVFRNINSISREIFASSTLYRRMVVQPLIRRFISEVDLVINQCVGMGEDFVAFTGCSRGKIITIYNPLSFELGSVPVSSSRIEQAAKSYFLYVGRLEKQKRVEDVLKAFKEFSSRMSRKFRLKICGSGSKESYLKLLAEQLKISDKVDFMGYCNELTSVYQMAIATLLTSEYEGFPNVLLESIAIGTPVISYNCPTGPDEIIDDGINGILVPNGDVGAFSEAMLKLVQRPLCSSGVTASARQYDSRNIATQYLDALNGVMKINIR